MRQPTPLPVLYAWHSAALRGEAPPTHEGEPQCGWFKTRLVKGGPWVAVRIWCDRDVDPETGELTAPEVLRCEANGRPLTPTELSDLWTWLKPISGREYADLIKTIAATPAMHDPYRKIDLTREGVSL